MTICGDVHEARKEENVVPWFLKQQRRRKRSRCENEMHRCAQTTSLYRSAMKETPTCGAVLDIDANMPRCCA